MMRLGADGVFVGSGIFKSEAPALFAKAIVEATTHFQDPEVIARVSTGLGPAMRGIAVGSLPQQELLATRGW
jgi:pyridoxal 5'-phosphate synthase pdxS subunit